MKADMRLSRTVLTRGLGMAGCAAVMVGAGGMAGGCRSSLNISPNDPGILDASAMVLVPQELAKLEFLFGSWRSLQGQELNEETWSVPHGNAMTGMFRTTGSDGSLRMQEALAIVAEADGVYMRLRHFDAKMTAREEKDSPVVLKLEQSEHARMVIPPDAVADEPVQLAADRWDAVFRCVSGSSVLASISYARLDGTLHVEVAFTPESKRETIRIQMRRLAAFPY